MRLCNLSTIHMPLISYLKLLYNLSTSDFQADLNLFDYGVIYTVCAPIPAISTVLDGFFKVEADRKGFALRQKFRSNWIYTINQ